MRNLRNALIALTVILVMTVSFFVWLLTDNLAPLALSYIVGWAGILSLDEDAKPDKSAKGKGWDASDVDYFNDKF